MQTSCLHHRGGAVFVVLVDLCYVIVPLYVTVLKWLWMFSVCRQRLVTNVHIWFIHRWVSSCVSVVILAGYKAYSLHQRNWQISTKWTKSWLTDRGFLTASMWRLPANLYNNQLFINKLMVEIFLFDHVVVSNFTMLWLQQSFDDLRRQQF